MQIGFSAPQGCGKTTLVFALDYLFKTTKKYIDLLHLISCNSCDSYTNKAISQEVGDDINRRFLLDCTRPGKMYFKIILVTSVDWTFSRLHFLASLFFLRLN